MTLFTTAYFPSISYMARFLQEDAPVIEVWETYHKQTYRNRCRVMTANGVESLSVPVVKVNGNHTMTKDMAISPIEPWQHIHSRCLESAYKAAPYFDHYYDYLRPIFEGHFERLIDLNDAAFAERLCTDLAPLLSEKARAASPESVFVSGASRFPSSPSPGSLPHLMTYS